MGKIKRFGLLVWILLVVATAANAQDSSKEARKLLDDVSNNINLYENLFIKFTSSLVNEDAGIKKGDEPPIKGEIYMQGEKYNLNYLGNNFLFDSEKLYVINHDDKEITINDEDMSEDEGFIYPSKLTTFYKEGYNYKLGSIKQVKGKKIQYVILTPIDSDSEIVEVQLGMHSRKNELFQLIQIGANGAKTTLEVKTFKGNIKLPVGIFTFDQAKYEKLDYLID